MNDTPATAASQRPEPCLWIRDLDDILTPRGQDVVAQIRATCQCGECTQLRSDKP